MPRIYMRDSLTLDLRTADTTLFHCDTASGSSTSLLVRVAATHAGILNGNYRFYRPDKMMKGTPSWFADGTYNRPVLAHHDEESSALGRVLTAKYVDLSYLYKNDYPILTDSVFYCSDAKKRMSMFESIDWVVDCLSKVPDYQGLGMIELGLKITEPEAMARVLRKEFLTVSVGFATDSAICSVCHQDWAVDDRCEHELGKKYDGKAAYVISGEMDFNEVSFVNSPADPFATTLSVEKLTDSVNRNFFLGLSLKEQNKRAKAAGIFLTDALYSSDIEMLGEQTMKLDLKVIADEIRTGVVEDRALAIRKDLTAFKGDTPEETKDAKKLLSTIRAKIKSNAWGAVPVVDGTEIDASNKIAKDAVAAELAAAAVQETSAEVNVTDGVVPPAIPASTLSLSDAVTRVFTAIECSDANESLKKVVASLETEYLALDDSQKRYLRYAIGGLTSSWYAREEFDSYMTYLTKDTDMVVLPKAEHVELTAAVDAFAESEAELINQRDSEETAKLSIFRKCKDALATMIVMNKVLTGHKAFSGLNKDQVQAEITKRSSRDLSSLQDMRDEILDELQWATPAAVVKAPAVLPGLAVQDSAELNVTNPLAVRDSTGEIVVEPAIRDIPMSRREQQEADSRLRYELASK